MSDQKQYVGNAKKISFQNGGEIMNVSINFAQLFGALIKEAKGKKYIDLSDLENLAKNNALKGFYFSAKGELHAKLVIAPRKEVGRFGETHTVAIDTYEAKPNEQQAPTTQPPAVQQKDNIGNYLPNVPPPTDEDLPF